jgi:hypothetical protein
LSTCDICWPLVLLMIVVVPVVFEVAVTDRVTESPVLKVMPVYVR